MIIYNIYASVQDYLDDVQLTWAYDLTKEKIEWHNQQGHVLTKTSTMIVGKAKRLEIRKLKK
jgi:hypothetical protein